MIRSVARALPRRQSCRRLGCVRHECPMSFVSLEHRAQ